MIFLGQILNRSQIKQLKRFKIIKTNLLFLNKILAEFNSIIQNKLGNYHSE